MKLFGLLASIAGRSLTSSSPASCTNVNRGCQHLTTTSEHTMPRVCLNLSSIRSLHQTNSSSRPQSSGSYPHHFRRLQLRPRHRRLARTTLQDPRRRRSSRRLPTRRVLLPTRHHPDLLPDNLPLQPHQHGQLRPLLRRFRRHALPPRRHTLELPTQQRSGRPTLEPRFHYPCERARRAQGPVSGYEVL